MKSFIYKWLPIFFSCHCRKDRSFFYKGQQFPICARCTGELAGIMIAIPVYFLISIPLPLCLILLVTCIVDGTLQLKTAYESHNIKRFITGLLFGFAMMILIFMSFEYVYHMGYEYGLSLNIIREHF